MYARHEAALAELTQSVLANTDLATLMDQAVTLVAHTLAVPRNAIWEVLPLRNALVLRASIGWPKDAVNLPTVAVETTFVMGCTVLGTTPVIVEDWSSETRFKQAFSPRGYAVTSSVYVAIPGQTHPLGSLGVDVAASRLFCDEEIRFLEAVANVLALAIERMQNRETFEQRLAQRTRILEDQWTATGSAPLSVITMRMVGNWSAHCSHMRAVGRRSRRNQAWHRLHVA